ncbi:hypothetical protein, partial [Hypericibacter sp.]|uniref:hypothetical protein n=1 Tax=Hypericibacter sp. TaxID=2705401 RepID=UPI003D6C8AD2
MSLEAISAETETTPFLTFPRKGRAVRGKLGIAEGQLVGWGFWLWLAGVDGRRSIDPVDGSPGK